MVLMVSLVVKQNDFLQALLVARLNINQQFYLERVKTIIGGLMQIALSTIG